MKVKQESFVTDRLQFDLQCGFSEANGSILKQMISEANGSLVVRNGKMMLSFSCDKIPRISS